MIDFRVEWYGFHLKLWCECQHVGQISQIIDHQIASHRVCLTNISIVSTVMPHFHFCFSIFENKYETLPKVSGNLNCGRELNDIWTCVINLCKEFPLWHRFIDARKKMVDGGRSGKHIFLRQILNHTRGPNDIYTFNVNLSLQCTL